MDVWSQKQLGSCTDTAQLAEYTAGKRVSMLAHQIVAVHHDDIVPNMRLGSSTLFGHVLWLVSLADTANYCCVQLLLSRPVLSPFFLGCTCTESC